MWIHRLRDSLIPPDFSCTLTTSHPAEAVEERLRKNISTALFLHSRTYPLAGTFAPPRFKVDLNTEDERSSTNFKGMLVRDASGTQIQITAELGVLGFVLPFVGLGGMSLGLAASGIVSPGFSWLLPPIALLLAGAFRRHEVRTYWRDVDTILDTLTYIVSAEVTHRSHDRIGRPLPGEIDAH